MKDNLEKDFLEYQEAFELKQLGFDEPCFGTASDIDITLKSDIKMPLFQQAFRFFRKKYDMSHSIDKDWDNGHLLGYEYVISEQEGVTVSKTYHTYEEAELGCLRAMIKLVKEHGQK